MKKIFKKGDRIIRDGDNCYDIITGNIYIVDSCDTNTNLRVEGNTHIFDANFIRGNNRN